MPGKRVSTLMRAFTLLSLVIFLSACSDSSNNSGSGSGSPQSQASARMATEGDLLSGPLARGVPGDYVLENEHLRVIIQKPGRLWPSVGTYGGNIIDVSAKDETGAMRPDHLEEFVLGLNIENTSHFTGVRIENDGSDGEAARICATGPDDLMDFANPSSVLGEFGLTLPPSADDTDLPVDIETCYSLQTGDRYIVMDSNITNQGGDELPTYLTEWLNGSGQVEFFQPFAGFGEPLATPSCPETTQVACDALPGGLCDQCNFIAYSGVDGAAGVSYGLIHGEQGSSSFSTSGVSVIAYGADVLNLLVGIEPSKTIPCLQMGPCRCAATLRWVTVLSPVLRLFGMSYSGLIQSTSAAW